jgi:LemA protein
MQKTLGIAFLVIAVFVILGFGWTISTSNHLVSLDEGVKEKWSQVENVYQRRADLIPNLVSTVKGYAKHEAEVLEEVTKARAQVGQVKIENGGSNPGDVQKFDQAQGQLTSALSRLLVVSERYPELKADKNFSELQSELEGTENRISIERMRFNEAAQGYNSYLRQFPQSMIAGLRGFKEREYFKANAGAQTAPKVEF